MFYDKLTVILSCEEPQSRYLGVSTAPDKINKSYFGRSFHWTVCTCGCPFNTRVEENVKHFRHRERFEPRSHFKSRLSLIVQVNVVLNRTVVVDSDRRLDYLCGSHLQSQSELYHVSWWYYTLVIDLIGQWGRDVIGRLSVKLAILTWHKLK